MGGADSGYSRTPKAQLTSARLSGLRSRPPGAELWMYFLPWSWLAQGWGPGGNSGWHGLATRREADSSACQETSRWRVRWERLLWSPSLAHHTLGPAATGRTPEASWTLGPTSSGIFFWSSTAEPDGKAR